MKHDQSNLKLLPQLSDVAGLTTYLEKVGNEYVGQCLCHVEYSPTLHIDDDEQTFHCVECGDKGTIIDWYKDVENLSSEHIEALIEEGYKLVSAGRKADKTPKQHFRDNSNYARSVWEDSKPLAGSLAEVYLRSYRLNSFGGVSLRYHPGLYNESSFTHHPALVAAVKREGRITGVQCIFLKSDGRGKADVEQTQMGLGVFTGGAVRLSPLKSEVILVKGIEDGLSLHSAYPGACVWTVPEWQNLISVPLPASVTTITIGSANDAAGIKAANKAKDHYIAKGYDVEIFYPRMFFKDFNNAYISKGL